MLPLLLCVCLLPFLTTSALLVARIFLNSLSKRYGPFPKPVVPPAIHRLVASMFVVARDDPEQAIVETPAPVPEIPAPTTKQPLEYLLAFDVEGTCVQGESPHGPTSPRLHVSRHWI